MRIWFSGSVISALAMVMIPATGMTAMSVEQKDYVFKMDVTRDISTSTFVIGEFNRTKQLRSPVAIPVTEKNKMLLSLRKREIDSTDEKQIQIDQTLIPPVLFDLSNSSLSGEMEEKLLSALEKKADNNTPLQVKGYTCDLGTQQVNDILALKRATVVADLLKSHGFIVVAVMGKGKQGYITSDPEMRHLNRRVEIGILTQSTTLEQ